MGVKAGSGEQGFDRVAFVEVRQVLELFLKAYSSIIGGEALDEHNIFEGEALDEHHIYERTPQGLRWVDTWPGAGTAENTFRQVEHLNKQERQELFWKLQCSSSNVSRGNTLSQTLADIADKNITLLHKGNKVVNIYQARGYMPLEGLDKEFVKDHSFKMERLDLAGNPTSSRLYPVLSEFLAHNDKVPSVPSDKFCQDRDCDRVVREAQTKSVAKIRGVGTDDICMHYWIVLTLENGTMLHIDTTGPIYECYELSDKGTYGMPLVLRETPELLLEEPKGELKKVFPDSVLMTNKCVDGTLAELPEWRVFDSFDVYPAEVMFLDPYRDPDGSIPKEEVLGDSLAMVKNSAISVLFALMLSAAEQDTLVELYNLKSNKFNGAQGIVKADIDPLEYLVNSRLPVTLIKGNGRTILVKIENIKFLPERPKQYLLWRQVERKMGWKHKLCKCVDWKKGLGRRKGHVYSVYNCDSDCSDHEDREEEKSCTICYPPCRDTCCAGKPSLSDVMPDFDPESEEMAMFMKEWESMKNKGF